MRIFHAIRPVTVSAVLLLSAFAVVGCGTSTAEYITDISNSFSSERMAVTPHDPLSLWNLRLGRDYAAAGRYELAKEHYLMALASCNNAESKMLVTHELQAVELMIQTQR